MRNVRVQLGRIAVVAILVGAWAALASTGAIDTFFISTPRDVGASLTRLLTYRDVTSALAVTGNSILSAFVFGVVAGGVIGFALGSVPILREAYYPLLLYVMSTPKVIFLPIFVMILGLGKASAVGFGTFQACIFVAVYITAGFGLIDKKHLVVAEAFKAGRLHKFGSIVMPSILPNVFTALWFGIKHAFTAVMIAELWGSNDGVGALIRIYTEQIRTADVLALVIAITFLAVVVGNAWNAVEARFTRWRTELTNAL